MDICFSNDTRKQDGPPDHERVDLQRWLKGVLNGRANQSVERDEHSKASGNVLQVFETMELDV